MSTPLEQIQSGGILPAWRLDTDAPPVDRALPQLALALDAGTMTDLLRNEGLIGHSHQLRVSYLRYKPATNCIVRYDVEGSNIPWAYAKITTGDRPGRASDRFRLSAYFDRHRMAVSLFPRDLQMPAVRLLLGDRAAARFTALVSYGGGNPTSEIAWEPVRYKPERRCVMRATRSGSGGPETFYARFYRGGEGFLTAGWHRHLGRTAGAKLIPTLAGYSAKRRLLVLAKMSGSTLEAVFDGPQNELRAAVEATSRTLAEWHQLPPPANLRPLVPELALETAAAILQTLMPESSPLVNDLLQRLMKARPCAPDQQALLHGDFYHDQVLIQDHQNARFVDLDELAAGDATFDLASFCAHLRLLALRGALTEQRARSIRTCLLQSYEQACGRSICRRRLRWHLTAWLMRLAPTPFRRLTAGWRRDVGRILAEADHVGRSL